MSELQNSLPPGWESMQDDKSTNCVYIRNTTSEDRNHYRPAHSTPTKRLITENIQLQHSSPELKLRNYVYPTLHASPKRAFQIPSPNSVQKDMRNVVTRLANSKIQDNSLIMTTSGIDEAISNIGAMFPTVAETHIKMLMKKYHNREALVISALQVEKHPITTPGPFATPPPQRNIIVQPKESPVTAVLRGGGALRGYSSPKLLTSSPKLKLRYMKSIFPQADETIILDILQNNDNNIQKTSDALKEMGFEKRDTVKLAQQKMEEKEVELKAANKEEKLKKTAVEQSEVRLKSTEEKLLLKEKLQKLYKDVAEHLISIALESVNFDEDRANKILQIMIQEDSEAAVLSKKEEEKLMMADRKSSKSLMVLPISQSRQSIKSLLKSDKIEEPNLFVRIIDETDFTSKNLSSTLGHNPTLSKGPNEKNLLEDYVKWYGPNPKLKTGTKSLAKGPNKDLLSNRTYRACGSNAALRKGPLVGLAKGSAFGKFNSTTSIVTVGRFD